PIQSPGVGCTYWGPRHRGAPCALIEDAILESPLVARILDHPSGLLQGKEQLREFFRRGTDNRPNELVHWHRTGRYLFGGRTLM
ncbi:MAG: hypothetical protein ABI137_07460, partial [Antricoccus sp.]